MADLQFPLAHDHALDQQLQDLLLLRQRRTVQSGTDPVAESRQIREHRPCARRLLADSDLLISQPDNGLTPLRQPATTLAQFFQADHLGLVGVDQSGLLAVEAIELNLELLDLRLARRIAL